MHSTLILIDTREQLPLVHGAWLKLSVGDYTTPKLLNRLHIERKSGEDLYGTLTKGNIRFRKELIRAADLGIELKVLVEMSEKNFVAKKFRYGDQRLFASESLQKMLRTFEEKYKLEFIWCRSRQAAKRKLLQLLK